MCRQGPCRLESCPHRHDVVNPSMKFVGRRAAGLGRGAEHSGRAVADDARNGHEPELLPADVAGAGAQPAGRIGVVTGAARCLRSPMRAGRPCRRSPESIRRIRRPIRGPSRALHPRHPRRFVCASALSGDERCNTTPHRARSIFLGESRSVGVSACARDAEDVAVGFPPSLRTSGEFASLLRP
jgi:hypothetical protein